MKLFLLKHFLVSSLALLTIFSFSPIGFAQEPILDEEPDDEAADAADAPDAPSMTAPPRRSRFTPPPSRSRPRSSGPANPAFDSIKKRQPKDPGEKTRAAFAGANLEDITDENFPELIDSFDFPNADIADVIKAISELTGRNFIVDPGVRGKITIIAPTRVTVAEAYKAFLSALAINGFTVVPSGKFYKIKASRQSHQDSEMFAGPYTPDIDQMITRVIQLKFIQAADVNKFLRTLISKDGHFLPYEPTNTIIVSDYGSNISRIQDIIEQIDVSTFNEQLSVIPIRFAKAKDIADLVEKIINKGESPSTNSRVPRFRRRSSGDNEKATALSLVLPDERTNSIIVVGNKAGIVKVKRLVSQLDFEIRPEDAGGVYVYYVKHGEAKSIADTLNGIAKQASGSGSSSSSTNRAGNATNRNTGNPSNTAAESGQFFGGEVKLTADEQTNSLIIAASRQDYEVVLNLLAKIDIPRDQVYVEAIIMEMEMNDNINYGFSLLNFQDDSSGIARQGFNGGNLGAATNVTGANGLVLGFGNGDDVSLTLGGSDVTVKSLTGFLNLLQTVTNTNILSTPQILALDNEEAEIEVGDRVPVASNTTTTNTGSEQNNVQFEDATIKLNITPFISPDRETIRMKVDQQVKQVAKRNPISNDLADIAITTTTRSLKSNVVVRNGDTVVIGGLMKDEDAPSVTKVPLLGDIPILGWLFKSKNVAIQKLNLLVFLTPKIIRSREDSRKLSDQKLKERLQFIKDNMGGRDAHGRVIEGIRKANSRNPASDDLAEEM